MRRKFISCFLLRLETNIVCHLSVLNNMKSKIYLYSIAIFWRWVTIVTPPFICMNLLVEINSQSFSHRTDVRRPYIFHFLFHFDSMMLSSYVAIVLILGLFSTSLKATTEHTILRGVPPTCKYKGYKILRIRYI